MYTNSLIIIDNCYFFLISRDVGFSTAHISGIHSNGCLQVLKSRVDKPTSERTTDVEMKKRNLRNPVLFRPLWRIIQRVKLDRDLARGIREVVSSN